MDKSGLELLVRAAARGFTEGLVNLELEPAKADLGERVGHLTLTDGQGTVVDLKLWNTPDLVARGHLVSGHIDGSAKPRKKTQTEEQREHVWGAAAAQVQLVRDIEITVERQFVAEMTAKARRMLSSSFVAPQSASSLEHDGMQLRIYQPDRAREIYTGHALGRRSGELLTFQFEPREQSMPGGGSSAAALPWIVILPIMWGVICAGALLVQLARSCEERAERTCGDAGVLWVKVNIKVSPTECTVDCEFECREPPEGEQPKHDPPIFEGMF